MATRKTHGGEVATTAIDAIGLTGIVRPLM